MVTREDRDRLRALLAEANRKDTDQGAQWSNDAKLNAAMRRALPSMLDALDAAETERDGGIAAAYHESQFARAREAEKAK